MYPAFFYALRKPPAGRVGAYRIRPPTRPGIWGECVFLVFKHRFIVIQAPFKLHSNSALRAVGEGRQGRQPSWPGTSNAYPDRFAGVRPLPRLGSWPGTSKARTEQTSPASVDARRLPQTPRGSVHQNFELAPPPPLRPPPQEPPLELLLLPLLHERLLRSSSRSRMVDELLSFSKVSSSFS